MGNVRTSSSRRFRLRIDPKYEYFPPVDLSLQVRLGLPRVRCGLQPGTRHARVRRRRDVEGAKAEGARGGVEHRAGVTKSANCLISSSVEGYSVFQPFEDNAA